MKRSPGTTRRFGFTVDRSTFGMRTAPTAPGSTNGASLLPPPLRPGDRVRLGKTVLEVVGPGPGATVVSMPRAVPVPPPAPPPSAVPYSSPVASYTPFAAAVPRTQKRPLFFWILITIGTLVFHCTLTALGFLLIWEGYIPNLFFVPGIHWLIRIEGIEVTFVRAVQSNTWYIRPGEIYKLPSSLDTLLVVIAMIPPEQYDWDKIVEWRVRLNGNIRPSVVIGEYKSDEEGVVTWVFVVRKTEERFILVLPDGRRINLRPILR